MTAIHLSSKNWWICRKAYLTHNSLSEQRCYMVHIRLSPLWPCMPGQKFMGLARCSLRCSETCCCEHSVSWRLVCHPHIRYQRPHPHQTSARGVHEAPRPLEQHFWSLWVLIPGCCRGLSMDPRTGSELRETLAMRDDYCLGKSCTNQS